jgi:hypothetical protein
VRPPAGLLLVLLLALKAAAVEPPKPSCALIKACGLVVESSSCTPEESRPIDGVTYDAQRCSEPRDLLAHGILPEAGMGAFVFPFLGGRYRVVYDITGEAPISEAKFDYLAEDLPLAAKLATRFSNTKYSIRFVDAAAKRFHAERADKLTGDAERLFFDAPAKRRAYYGWGSSKFGPWKLHGSTYLDVSVRKGVKNSKGITYDVRIRTAPVNAMINAIMRLGLFKGYVIGQIEDTMKDLVGAAAALSTQGVEKILKDPAFSAEEREKVRALAALP